MAPLLKRPSVVASSATTRTREAIIRDTLAFLVFEVMVVAAGWRFYVDGSEFLFPLLILQGYVAGSFSDKVLARFFALGGSGETAEDVLRERGRAGELTPGEAWELLQGVLADDLEQAGVKDEVKEKVKTQDRLSERDVEKIIARVKLALAEDAAAGGAGGKSPAAGGAEVRAEGGQGASGKRPRGAKTGEDEGV